MSIYQINPDQQPDWPQDHVRRYLASDGADGYWADFTAVGGPAKAPNLILTVTGRRSGKSHQNCGQNGRDKTHGFPRGACP